MKDVEAVNEALYLKRSRSSSPSERQIDPFEGLITPFTENRDNADFYYEFPAQVYIILVPDKKNRVSTWSNTILAKTFLKDLNTHPGTSSHPSLLST
ncbi:hypothetical protein H4I95_05782 [Botrytis cinerea]